MPLSFGGRTGGRAQPQRVAPRDASKAELTAFPDAAVPISTWEFCQSALLIGTNCRRACSPGAFERFKKFDSQVGAFFLALIFFFFFLILSFAADHLFCRWRQQPWWVTAGSRRVTRLRLQKESGIQREAKLEQRATSDLSCLFLPHVCVFLFNFYFSFDAFI